MAQLEERTVFTRFTRAMNTAVHRNFLRDLFRIEYNESSKCSHIPGGEI